eukprot:scaffold56378_cov41-Prasinocladus_malaysianus.AAC.1
MSASGNLTSGKAGGLAREGHRGVEATLYATLMSVLNGGSFTGQALGAGLTKVGEQSHTDCTN